MKLIHAAAAMLGALCISLALSPAFAQVAPSSATQSIRPLTRDLGCAVGSTTNCKLITLTAQGAGTLNSPDQTGYNVTRILCTFNMASHTGTPSSTFFIQNKDNASGNYYTVLTSPAITADTTPTVVALGGGVASGSASVAGVASGLPVSRTWRVSTTVGGSTPAVTGTVGCVVQ